MYCAMWLHYMKVYWHAQFTVITFFTHTHTWHVTLLPLQHPYSEGAPLLLHSVENISVAVAANLASNRNANVSQDGSMEAVFKTNHLGKEWIAGPSICSLHIHACKYTHMHTHTRTHTHTRAHTQTHTCIHTFYCLTSAIQVAQLQPSPSDDEDKLTYNDVMYPRNQDAISAVASSLNIPIDMVPQMVIPGALLEERASELKFNEDL